MRHWSVALIVGAALVATASPLLRQTMETMVHRTQAASHSGSAAPAGRPASTYAGLSTASVPAAPAAPLAQSIPDVSALGLGSMAGDLVYTRVSPCRIVDTRKLGQRLQAGETRHFHALTPSFSSQGGADHDCDMLWNAPAVVLNIVAVSPDDAGFLTVYAYGGSRPNASSLNYAPGEVIANEIVAKAGTGIYEFSVFSMQGVDLVIDVAGYFAPPVASGPECLINYGDWVSVPAGEFDTATGVCPAGYALVSGGCHWDHVNLKLIQYGQIAGHLNDDGSFSCEADNPTPEQADFRVKNLCCRVPGR